MRIGTFRTLIGVVLILLSMTTLAAAADVEISGAAGFGYVTGEAEDVRAGYIPGFGVSMSSRLGRPEIKVDYEYINRDRTGNLHMMGVGWLIQAEPQKIRPFFQAGWTFGIERSYIQQVVPGPGPNDPPIVFSRTATDKFQGLALSTGLTISTGARLFVRPEFRWRLIGPGPMMIAMPAVTLGYRF
jgi:hypothetical protein